MVLKAALSIGEKVGSLGSFTPQGMAINAAMGFLKTGSLEGAAKGALGGAGGPAGMISQMVMQNLAKDI